jgi:hypothetical protein
LGIQLAVGGWCNGAFLKNNLPLRKICQRFSPTFWEGNFQGRLMQHSFKNRKGLLVWTLMAGFALITTAVDAAAQFRFGTRLASSARMHRTHHGVLNAVIAEAANVKDQRLASS